MTGVANAARGEAIVAGRVLRPSFASLVAAEEEIGALFAVIERAAEGTLTLAEMVALFWHCLESRDGVLRSDFGDAVMAEGLAKATPALRVLLGQILRG